MESQPSDRKKVLFLCYHNSARSQMAEGLLRELYRDRYEAYSAGAQATEVDLRAIKVMREMGIDISNRRSKAANKYSGILFDIAVTMCDDAKVLCPVCAVSLQPSAFAPAAKVTIHRTFIDPATVVGSDEDRLVVFRQVRDEIRNWIIKTFGDS
jgi:arsenate reductase